MGTLLSDTVAFVPVWCERHNYLSVTSHKSMGQHRDQLQYELAAYNNMSVQEVMEARSSHRPLILPHAAKNPARLWDPSGKNHEWRVCLCFCLFVCLFDVVILLYVADLCADVV